MTGVTDVVLVDMCHYMTGEGKNPTRSLTDVIMNMLTPVK